MSTVSFVTVVHAEKDFDAEAVDRRIRAVHSDAISVGIAFDVILIDNSPRPIREIQNLADDINAIHRWCDGYNTFHGPSMNMAAEMSKQDVIVYFCASHGYSIDPTWITDLIAPLGDKRCGMTGCSAKCLYDRVSTNPADWRRPQVHIQGAVAAMRRELLLEIPYGHRFPFEYSDVEMCLTLMQRGYYLANIESIRSVAIGVADRRGAKYVHDYS